MGFIDSANALSNTETSETTEVLVILNLLQMQWPGLDQGKAVAKVNKYLKKKGLSAGR